MADYNSYKKRLQLSLYGDIRLFSFDLIGSNRIVHALAHKALHIIYKIS